MRVDGDVDSMWESFIKYVIEVHDRHIPLMWIGRRKWKSEHTADMGIDNAIDQGSDKKDIENSLHTSLHQEVLSFEFYTTG